MIIELNKTYNIAPKWKKSLVEEEFFTHEDGRVIGVSTLWRSGSFNITPQNEDEVKELTEALESEDTFEPYSFEDYEMCDMWDGCSEDIYFYTKKWTEEQKEAIQEAHDEGDDFISNILEEFEFYPDDCEVQVFNGIMIQED